MRWKSISNALTRKKQTDPIVEDVQPGESRKLTTSSLENCLDDELVGNDGLTDTERKEYADRYAAGPGRGLTDQNRASIKQLRERRDDESKRDQS